MNKDGASTLVVVCVSMVDRIAECPEEFLATFINSRSSRPLASGDQLPVQKLTDRAGNRLTGELLVSQLDAAGLSLVRMAGGSGANTARMAAWLSGANDHCSGQTAVSFCSAIGKDADGDCMAAAFAGAGVQFVGPVVDGSTTGVRALDSTLLVASVLSAARRWCCDSQHGWCTCRPPSCWCLLDRKTEQSSSA